MLSGACGFSRQVLESTLLVFSLPIASFPQFSFRMGEVQGAQDNCGTKLRSASCVCVGYMRGGFGGAYEDVKQPYLTRLLRCKSPCSFRGQFCLGSLLVSDRGVFLHWEEVSSCPTFNIQISDEKRGREKGDLRCRR